MRHLAGRSAHSLHQPSEGLGIRDQVQLESVALNDFRSVIQALFKVQPDEIYHLAGQSSVSLSFEQPVETQESIHVATLNLLEAIRFTRREIRFYNASSSECFGDLTWAAKSRTRKRLSGPEARMPSRNPPPFGRWRIIGRPMACSHVREFSSITNHRCVRRIS